LPATLKLALLLQASVLAEDLGEGRCIHSQGWASWNPSRQLVSVHVAVRSQHTHWGHPPESIQPRPAQIITSSGVEVHDLWPLTLRPLRALRPLWLSFLFLRAPGTPEACGEFL
jgi:hypothetical protein